MTRDQVSLVSAASLVASGLAMPVVGRLPDCFGSPPMFSWRPFIMRAGLAGGYAAVVWLSIALPLVNSALVLSIRRRRGPRT